ncbi:MAG: glycoside hydrolase family 95 protein [Clostridium sp.]|nr:glycoside hydrolase family 95 protein [Clostridium sp.]
MKNFMKNCVTGAVLLLSLQGFAQEDHQPVLWYQHPAREWMEAIPVGNGRLGAMVFGGIKTERIALNEMTLWAGQRDEQQNDHCGPEHLAEIRQAFFDGDMVAGNELANQYLRGFSQSFGTHLPMGEMTLLFDYPSSSVDDYRRELDMENAVATTTFRTGDVCYRRTVFCDYPDSVLVVRVEADKPGSVTMTLATDLLRQAEHKTAGSTLSFNGTVDYPMFGPGGVSFYTNMTVVPERGTVSRGEDFVKLSGADAATVIVDIRTNMFDNDYRATADRGVSAAISKGYASLLENHKADVTPLFNRMSLNLGDPGRDNLPTDVRLHLIKGGAVDPGFDALFFSYGRYMQIASSRPNSPLCSNLQGIWNDDLACHMGWTCDYHLDININQNYWSPNKANLAECNEGLWTYLRLLEKYGSETAQKVYGCRGWCAHTVTNPWGYTAPGGDVGWGLNVTAGAWMATELWSHYRYTLDRDFLAETGYPLLKSCAEFFVDYMVEDPETGYLVTGPSISPENGFRTPEGHGLSASMMPTLDRAIVADIYTACIESSKILGVDKKFRQRLEKDIAKLPPLVVDQRGEVQEWLHGYPRQDPAHRHTSHLMALYPLAQITWTKSPELMEAARLTIENQTSAPGWEDTEWSAANMLCFYSFLKDGDQAHNWLQDLYRNFTRENLMTVSPKGIAGAPADIFSFDANEAGVSGICDMLLQSHDGFVEFLPALPQAWESGSIRGVCAEGALEADLEWAAMKPVRASMRASRPTSFKVLVPEDMKVTLDGKQQSLKRSAEGLVEFKLQPGQSLDFEI